MWGKPHLDIGLMPKKFWVKLEEVEGKTLVKPVYITELTWKALVEEICIIFEVDGAKVDKITCLNEQSVLSTDEHIIAIKDESELQVSFKKL